MKSRLFLQFAYIALYNKSQVTGNKMLKKTARDHEEQIAKYQDLISKYGNVTFSKAATMLMGVLKGACWRDCAFDMVKKTGGANNSGIDKLADRDQFNSLMGHLYGDSS